MVPVVNVPAKRIHDRDRAESFFRAALHLAEYAEEDGVSFGAATGLLAVHSGIAMGDAVLCMLDGRRESDEDHRTAGTRLEKACSSRSKNASGAKYLQWLVGKKYHFSYDDRFVTEESLKQARDQISKFIAWTYRTFPELAREGSIQ